MIAIAIAAFPASSPAMTAPDKPAIRFAASQGLIVPDTVDAAQKVTAIVSNAIGGHLELWGPVTQAGRGGRILKLPVQGASVLVRAPTDSGSYELRHIAPDGRIVARAPMDVVAAPVSLQVTDAVGIGGTIQITWLGPADPGDRLQIVSRRSGVLHGEIDAIGAGSRATKATMPAPAEPGLYELRYVNGDNIVLRDTSFEVVSGGGWLRTPLAVSPGQRFELEWFGGLPPGFVFRIVTLRRASTLTETPVILGAGETATGVITAPNDPGKYQIQLVNPSSDNVVTSLPLTVR